MERLKKFKTAFIVSSIFYIILGIVLIARPETSARAICRVFGVLILLLGVIRVIRYFAGNDFEDQFKFDLARGILASMFGIFMLIAPKAVIVALPVLLGLAIIIDSVLRLQLSIDLKRLQYEKWWTGLIMALVTGVLGVMLFFNPFAGSIALTMYIGISLVIDGIVNIWALILLTKHFNNYSIW
ncbi:MAG: DUF308 domain-containing protein [Xylanivirga thermophila]|jgi:uncharacterized membrane protein HdeD (DUF308 family)|uniref:HdeD family acid-resistance protein n=1 Tax=Xylanivirga thermophila TaxID=2496273 RepID=UPI0039F59624